MIFFINLEIYTQRICKFHITTQPDYTIVNSKPKIEHSKFFFLSNYKIHGQNLLNESASAQNIHQRRLCCVRSRVVHFTSSFTNWSNIRLNNKR